MANMSLKKNPMPSQEPDVRNKNFDEVALGYTAEMAIDEAQRCLNCKNPKCVNGCPVNVHIPEFISKVAEGKFDEAFGVITSTNSLPAICGRVCPQENQCEGQCVRGIKGRAGGHRPSGAVRGRLSQRPRTPGRRPHCTGEQRPQGGGRGIWSRRSYLRRRSCPEGV